MKKLPVILNRKALHDYEILQKIEAGIALKGTEVKSIRAGRCQITGSFARIEHARPARRGGAHKRSELWLHNAHIEEYEFGNIANHDPKRSRKLLLHRHELERLASQTTGRNKALIPLRLYFKKGRVKIELGLGRGKTEYDKRQILRRKTAAREIDRSLRSRPQK